MLSCKVYIEGQAYGTSVLILIVLEGALVLKNLQFAKTIDAAVLILIVLEGALVQMYGMTFLTRSWQVLILIVLEGALVPR